MRGASAGSLERLTDQLGSAIESGADAAGDGAVQQVLFDRRHGDLLDRLPQLRSVAAVAPGAGCGPPGHAASAASRRVERSGDRTARAKAR